MSFLDSGGFLKTLKSPSNTAVEFIKLFLVLYKAGVLLPKTFSYFGRNDCFVFHKIQMIAVLVDKMIRTQIVDCAAVANWIFSSELAHDFTR